MNWTQVIDPLNSIGLSALVATVPIFFIFWALIIKKMKGYTDFLRLYKIHINGSFFVTRAKENLRFKRMYSRIVDKTTGFQSDHIGNLVVYKSKIEYPAKLSRLKFYDCEHDKKLVFLTNNMDLKASEIASSINNDGKWNCFSNG